MLSMQFYVVTELSSIFLNTMSHNFTNNRLGFLWKYGGLYLDHDVLVIKPLLEESTKAGRLDRKSKPKNLYPTYNFLGQNYIGFQSLNISHLMPNDPTPGENQELYMEDTDSQGNIVMACFFYL